MSKFSRGCRVHTKSALGLRLLRGVVTREQDFGWRVEGEPYRPHLEKALVIRTEGPCPGGLEEGRWVDDGGGVKIYLMPGEIFRDDTEVWLCKAENCKTCREMRAEGWL